VTAPSFTVTAHHYTHDQKECYLLFLSYVNVRFIGQCDFTLCSYRSDQKVCYKKTKLGYVTLTLKKNWYFIVWLFRVRFSISDDASLLRERKIKSFSIKNPFLLHFQIFLFLVFLWALSNRTGKFPIAFSFIFRRKFHKIPYLIILKAAR
jgi:hypothetical protein